MNSEQMSPYARLRVAIEASGLTIKDYANKAGIAHKTLQNYVTGTRKIGIEAMIGMCNQMGLNLNWLASGQGEMYRADTAAGAGLGGGETLKELCQVAEGLEPEQRLALLAIAKLFGK